MNNLSRTENLVEKVVLIDGYSASGKSLLQQLVQSFEGVEKFEMSHIFKDISLLNYLGKMTDDAARSFINIYADNFLYSSMISRNTNFRPYDDSSVFKNYRKFKQIARLFYRDGDKVIERIRDDKPVLSIMTHFGLCSSRAIFEAFQERLTYLSVVRHPVYILDHWSKYIGRFCKDKREFSFCYEESNGKSYPWFVSEWKESYDQLNNMEKAIRTILHMDKITSQTVESFNQEFKIVTIPFEKFLTHTDDYIEVIEKAIGRSQTNLTKNFLTNHNLPSKFFSGRISSRGLFGWKITKSTNDKKDYSNRISYIQKNCRKEIFEDLMESASIYEKKHLINL